MQPWQVAFGGSIVVLSPLGVMLGYELSYLSGYWDLVFGRYAYHIVGATLTVFFVVMFGLYQVARSLSLGDVGSRLDVLDRTIRDGRARLLRVYDAQGGDVLARVLRTLRDAYDAAPVAFGRVVIEGLALVFGRHPKIDDDVLVSVLGKDRHGVHGLLRRAEEHRERLGRPQPQCVAAAAVDLYNRERRGKARLPRWWKL